MGGSARQSPHHETGTSELRAKQSLLSPETIRFHSPYDYIKRSRSMTPMGSQSSTTGDNRLLRRRLRTYETFDDAVALLKSSCNIIILTGAGISTAVGIPDFRSKGGLYNDSTARKRFADPQELFTLDTFCAQPLAFYEDVRPIIPKLREADKGGRPTAPVQLVAYVPKYSLAHSFLKLINDKNKLQTIYTQNIDGLEKEAGVDPGKVINCHGSWETATCLTCRSKVSADAYLPVIYQGILPICVCARPVELSPSAQPFRAMRDRPKQSDVRVGYLEPLSRSSRKLSAPATATSKKRKRPDEDESQDPISRPGLLKPDITFFDEKIHKAYEPRLWADAENVDLLLIIGTSLPVEPVNTLPFEIPENIPQIWICNESCKRDGLKVDIELLGKCDLVIEELCRRAGWTSGLQNRAWRNRYGSVAQQKAQLATAKAMTSKQSSLSTAGAVEGNNDLSQKIARKEAVRSDFESTLVKQRAEQAEHHVKTGGSPLKHEVKPTTAPALTITETLTNIPGFQVSSTVTTTLRPNSNIQFDDAASDISRTSSAKTKSLPKSKVKVEEVLGFPGQWLVKSIV